ncbi:transglycosylase SLT domain-containing protein [Advenella alkanexedens]|uniref:Transglycosylase SLT domain-containing protein n=2 Tax=Advenella alkanexedens TaxID=1481665 RepID=A0ABS6NQ39_9BURK|nr:transglycosylase SLT domain-containing protein [Advenella alkanexedens]NLN68806.1 transglycosylase SLT domain-containing protein [Alcaligenaceae bacterium]
MPDLQDDRVEYWTNYYAARPASVQIMAQRSSKYIHYITQELERRNMPTELALLPFVESAYNAKAVSSAKAAGLWQFIPSTGTHYNLTQDWWKDERRDPVQSTHAALNYLSYLHGFQDNDWHLALASYNWGEGAVKRARERNASTGLGTDYLSLKMPKETRDYVPKLQAFENIIRNPARYGIKLPHVPDQPYFEKVSNTHDIDLDVAARLAEISVEEFRELNPSFQRSVLLDEHASQILLPKHKVTAFKRNLKNYQGELSAWEGYTPAPGESLASIADKHGISLDKLKSLNGYGSKQSVALSSRTLMVPRNSGASAGITPNDIMAPAINTAAPAMLASNDNVARPSAMSPTVPARASAPVPSAVYTKKPDVAAALAARNIDPLVDIINSGNNASLTAGVRAVPVAASKAAIPATVSRPAVYTRPAVAAVAQTPAKPAVRTASLTKPAPKAEAKKKVSAHKVVKGDTLYSLAKRYNTSVQDLKALNNMSNTDLKPGASLRIPGAGSRG